MIQALYGDADHMMIEQIVIGTVLMVQMVGMMVQQSILNHTMLVKVDN